MKIETKFDIGDRVFYMKNNKVENNIIVNIEIVVGIELEEHGMINYDNIKAIIQSEIYFVDMNRDLLHPSWLFKTKEELLKSL